MSVKQRVFVSYVIRVLATRLYLGFFAFDLHYEHLPPQKAHRVRGGGSEYRFLIRGDTHMRQTTLEVLISCRHGGRELGLLGCKRCFLFPLCAAIHAYVPKVRKERVEGGYQGK